MIELSFPGEVETCDVINVIEFSNCIVFDIFLLRRVLPFNSEIFISEQQTIYLSGRNGTLLSPYYPHSYSFPEIEDLHYIYHVDVSHGHALLNFTEINLSSRPGFISGHYLSDVIIVYDGNSTSAEELWRFKGHQSKELPVTILATGKQLTVRFLTSLGPQSEKVYRFKAFYTREVNGKFDSLRTL